MFTTQFETILNKIKAGYKLEIKEKILLWAKKLGFFGMAYGIIAVISLILSATKGSLFGLTYWEIFLISFSIFATKNWDALVLLVNKEYK